MKIEQFVHTQADPLGRKDIEVWQLARKMTQKIYRMTRKLRFARDYGLKGQIIQP